MVRRRFLQLAFTISVFGGTFLAGCGGGGKSGAVGDSGGRLSRQTVDVTVEMPGGRSSEGMRAATFLSENPVSAGRAKVDIFETGPQFARLVSSTGATMLIGFVSPERTTLSVRSTAEAALYLHLGGFLLTQPVRNALLNELSSSDAVTPLADTLTQVLTTAEALDLNEARIVTALGNAASQFTGVNAQGRAGRSVLVEPGGTLSGISILNTGIDTIKIQNLFRRRASAFIERVGYKDAEGNDHAVEPAQEIYRMEIAPLSGVPSVLNATAEILAQMSVEGSSLSSLVPSVTDTLTLPKIPTLASSTQYRVTICGGGATAGDQGRITAEQEQLRKYMVLKEVVFDIVTPLIVTIILPTVADGFLPNPIPNEAYNDSILILTTLLNLVLNVAPDVLAKADSGDIAGAALALLQSLVTDTTLQTALLSHLYYNLVVSGKDGGIRGKLFEMLPDVDDVEFIGKAATVFNILGLADRILAAADLVLWAEGAVRSNRADIWNVSIADSKVRLTPETAQVAAEQQVDLTADVADKPEEGIITYRWTLDGSNGVLTNPVSGISGSSFDSATPTVRYTTQANPNSDQKDTVTVEAFLGGVNASNRRSLGKATSVLSVSQGKYILQRFDVDDNLTLWLNDVVIHEDRRGEYAGSRGPFELDAERGSKLRVQVQDWYGSYASVGDLVLVRPDGTKQMLASGFQKETPIGNKSIIFDQTFTLD